MGWLTWLTGIYRDVYLLAYPDLARIEDFFIKTDLDDDYADAELIVELDLSLRLTCDLKITLCSPNQDSKIFSDQVALESHDTRWQKNYPVKAPLKWTAETPVLYHVELGLSSKGRSLQKIQHRIGFRKVEIKKGLLTVNGAPILLRVVNRHEHHPDFGRAVPVDFLREDLVLMKRHNINAMRCSHYPSQPALYSLCDELGLWVLDEADLECHGFNDAVARSLSGAEGMDYAQRKALTFDHAASFTSDNKDWETAYIDRMTQLVQRDKNFTCVIIWSLGNESFYGRNHKAMYQYAKRVDPSRPVHYEGDSKAITTDMYSYMYTSVPDLVSLAREEGVSPDGSYEKPIILCEYGHAMGNGPGLLEDYQAAFREHERLQGGFIWEWANHGLRKASDEVEGKDIFAYGGDFGDVPNDGTFVMDGLCYSNHTPTPGLTELKKAIAPIRAWFEPNSDKITVENRFNFKTLEGFAAHYEVEALADTRELLTSGLLDIPSVNPGSASTIALPKEVLQYRGYAKAECWLTVMFTLKDNCAWADSGHEVTFVQHQLNIKHPLFDKPVIAPKPQPLDVSSTRQYLSIAGPDFSVSFDKIHGLIKSWTFRGTPLLHEPEWPVGPIQLGFWRAPTDNDAAWQTERWKHWGLNSLTTQLRAFDVYHPSVDETQVKATTYVGPPILAWGFHVETTYRIGATGTISIRVHVKPVGSAPKNLPRAGWDFQLSKVFEHARWFGLGPGESYHDKKSAQRVGVFDASIPALHTPYEVPQENGNHVDTRWVEVLDGRGMGMKITLSGAKRNPATFHFAVSEYPAAELERAKHGPELVKGDAIYLRVDRDVSGVGTGACGPAIKEQDLVRCEEMEFEVSLEPVLP
ncbi:hypothetical protein, variant [Exophiala oligosperma]|uniref:Lactase n=1 Tax=Exophiala oligosperma TaxID=215243 RepID=A0A0D2DQA2_9EURO|nr:hypothetical protein, variant [Exophiala oligosperma]KIW37989.1 hypothetical protein, variant [Exophiala oligosperma]